LEERQITAPTKNPLPRLIGILESPDGASAEMWRQVEAALAAGLPALMLRQRQGTDEAPRPLAMRLRNLTAETGALFLMNRRLDLAVECGADGVHTGQHGIKPATLRAALGPERLIGYSAHGKAEALAALGQGADYVTFSPIFDTPSKRGLLTPVGLEPLRDLCAEADKPVIALGGIGQSNLGEVLEAGAHGAAMIRGVFAPGGDAGAAVTRLLAILTRYGERRESLTLRG
jgi:thiamine-phosphate pyrophosphorylase